MPKRNTDSVPGNPNQFFVKELSGETPPAFSTMEKLYGLATQLYALRPWHLVNENQLVLVRGSSTGETCYCSVMGQLGEVLAMHAYRGRESYRLFRRLEAGDAISPSEFLAGQHSVYVDFVPSTEMDVEDRKMLKAVGHPRASKIGPIFRAIHPGFHPWFVTEEEARMLAECIGAMVLICSMVSRQGALDYWDIQDVYPQLSRLEGEHTPLRYHVELVKAPMPHEPPFSPAPLAQEQLHLLSKQDYPVKGIIELDHFPSDMIIGKKNERKGTVRITLAVEANSGFLFPPELASPGVSAGESLVKALVKAVETSHFLPAEVRVLDRRFKDCLNPISEACGFPVEVVSSLPALATARNELVRMLSRSGFGR